jgi:hypothetical protein
MFKEETGEIKICKTLIASKDRLHHGPQAGRQQGPPAGRPPEQHPVVQEKEIKNKKHLLMKKTFILLHIAMIGLSINLSAQSTRLNVYGSYIFDDAVDSYYDQNSYYKGKVEGGFQWGVGVEFMRNRAMGLELTYLHQSTTAPFTYYKNGVKTTIFDLKLNYIMLGGNRYFGQPKSKVEGFAGVMAGINFNTLENPDNNNSSNKSFFAWGLKGGMNFWASEKIGLKLQAQLLCPVQSVGGGFYFGTGGVGTGLSSYSSIYQFGLGGGLVFKLGGNKK